MKEGFNISIGGRTYYGDFTNSCKRCTFNNTTNNLSCSCNNQPRSNYKINNVNNIPFITNRNNKLATHPNQYISIRHNGGKCVHPAGGKSNPDNWTEALLYDGCNADRLRFRFTDNFGKKTGRIIHKTSGKCLRPAGRSGIGNNTRIQFAPPNECQDSRSIFTLLSNGSIQHSSGKCIHPLGGSSNPGNNTRIVLYDGCGVPENKLKFKLLSYN